MEDETLGTLADREELVQELRRHGLDVFRVKHGTSDASRRVVLSALQSKPIKPSLSGAQVAAQLDKVVLRALRDRQTLDLTNTVQAAADLIRTARHVLVLTGAGISTSCGIPDFRSSDGLFAQLQAEARAMSAGSHAGQDPADVPARREKRKAAIQASRALEARSAYSGGTSVYDLQDPQEITDIRVFRVHPEIFYSFADRLYPAPGRLPSASHRFIRLLETEGKLLRNYTQNVDTLESVAGITRYIACHGSFATASCMRCHVQVPGQSIEADVLAHRVPLCGACKPGPKRARAVMKPDITFFHEPLQPTYGALLAEDRRVVDLLLVMGTSLPVEPIKDLPFMIPHRVPQILISRERPRDMRPDIWLEGDCDDLVRQLCKELGWTLD